ncbi:hypothetical protein ACFFX1_11130 [Dactylosporangium sucinum]|uniref:Uncharacterized protein n=1 Tax=Dactylosporangium sucinum TaxID=1424081 RepID=A0A917WR19_9ACTN|nr:hypothetical protein [Dactylosporangium sucinum]GGM22438.1 hypothetical protein GCM10007977_024500 [Dactylosporangium sucinum]
MTGPAGSRDALLRAVLAERFPTDGEVRREAHRRPRPLTAPAPAVRADRDDELTLARRRQVLNDALTPTFGHRGRPAAGPQEGGCRCPTTTTRSA